MSLGKHLASIERKVEWDRDKSGVDYLIDREWLVTNGLGGYASTSLASISTRKYHGLLVAKTATPHGRVVMLANVLEEYRPPGGRQWIQLGGKYHSRDDFFQSGFRYLSGFRLEAGLPVWRYEIDEAIIEKKIVMPHHQNMVFLNYKLISGKSPINLRLRPFVQFRSINLPVPKIVSRNYTLNLTSDQCEISSDQDLPTLRLLVYGGSSRLQINEDEQREYFDRGPGRKRCDECRGPLWSPGYFVLRISLNEEVTLVASTEPWNVTRALHPESVFEAEIRRRERLIAYVKPELQLGTPAELILAADQFLITPKDRLVDSAWIQAVGDEVRSIVAGYHWFKDWGRDTMVSLEGLALLTGRHADAGSILRTFGHYVRAGLVPKMFPAGDRPGKYSTADVSLWYFHAAGRYMQATNDWLTIQQLMPTLIDIVDHYLKGTDFNIRVDPADGLITQGVNDAPLTWMDANEDGWVVTPRRGKAVEINALWYNALRLLEGWLKMGYGDEKKLVEISAQAEIVKESFNRRFWYEEGGYLFDVVDGDSGNDASLRPNQIFALSLDHPVLDAARWASVLHVVTENLLTPLGLRSLSPDHPDYRNHYRGDLCERDSAYHQGTVWPWLIGAYVDAWIRVNPERRKEARKFLESIVAELGNACIGSISEVFDPEPPYNPGGCIAQAWSVAEAIRSWAATE